MAAKAEQQLSLIAGLEIQGDLFGAASGGASSGGERPSAEQKREALDAKALSEAAQRPRQRRQPPNPGPAKTAPENPAAPSDEPPGEGDNDLPAWHHHGLVDPQQLTPMLRHYVELKAAHPE
ncbi:MAG: DNA mismatch repair protein MutS, partial [Cyanobium sp.]